MDPLPLATTVTAVVAVVSLVAVAALVAGHRRLERQLRGTRAEVDSLRSRLDDLAEDRFEPATAAAHVPTRQTSRHSARVPAHLSAAEDARRDAPDFLITDLAGSDQLEPESGTTGPVVPLTGREFASVALGESLLRLATLAHGVRRAASPENRNRIGFEMRREVKRSRRQRRLDTRDALRATRRADRPVLGADGTTPVAAAPVATTPVATSGTPGPTRAGLTEDAA